ncbi:apolipoprotein D-like [Vanessa atalanta]|uniref:apolipoprotein D-like n=1 Tax=Vanessa atalanta TaxID=42275 RepID=UPI001FCCF34E|nr:apolipoprotein D-like [Vanessa atalanta]
MMYRLVSLLCLVSVATGQLQLPGPCNWTNINYQRSINPDELVGKWNEIERVANSYENGTCSSWTLTAVKQNNVIVGMNILIQDVFNKKLYSLNGNLTITPTFTIIATFTDGLVVPFVIMETNYKDYAVIYSCIDQGQHGIVLAWKLSRTTQLSNATKVAFQEHDGLAKGNWTAISHTEDACKITNNAIKTYINPIILVIVGLVIGKDSF